MLPQWYVHYSLLVCKMFGTNSLRKKFRYWRKTVVNFTIVAEPVCFKVWLWLWLQVWKWYLEYFLKICLKPQKQAPNSGLKLNVFGSTTLFETVFRIRIRYWQTDLATLDKYLKMDPFSIKLRPCCFQSTIKKKINLHLLNQFTVAVVIKTII